MLVKKSGPHQGTRQRKNAMAYSHLSVSQQIVKTKVVEGLMCKHNGTEIMGIVTRSTAKKTRYMKRCIFRYQIYSTHIPSLKSRANYYRSSEG